MKTSELRKLLDKHPGTWSKSRCICGHPSCHSWFLSLTRSNGRVDESEADLVIGMKTALPTLLEAVELLDNLLDNIHLDGKDNYYIVTHEDNEPVTLARTALEKLK